MKIGLKVAYRAQRSSVGRRPADARRRRRRSWQRSCYRLREGREVRVERFRGARAREVPATTQTRTRRRGSTSRSCSLTIDLDADEQLCADLAAPTYPID